MRKYFMLLALVIVAIIFLSIIVNGLKFGKAKINSYSEIHRISSERKELLTALENKNENDFQSKKDKLDAAVVEYKSKKAEYDKLVSEGKVTEETVQKSIDLYDMDFLWTIIGNYATKNGVTLQLDVSKSSTSTAISSEYTMCDLSFTVTGEYIAITNFIYSLEDDPKLGFEIKNFLLEKGGENLQATFVVKEVSINSQNLSSIPTISSAVYDKTVTSNN